LSPFDYSGKKRAKYYRTMPIGFVASFNLIDIGKDEMQ